MFRRSIGPLFFTERLRCSTQELYFTADFTLFWQRRVSRRRQSQPEAAARKLVLDTAESHSRRMPLTRAIAAQAQINTALGQLGATNSDVRVRHAVVHLSVDPDMLQRAQEYGHRLREEKLANQAQRYEFERLRRFRETVLADPAAAMAYWFMRHPNELDIGVYTKIETLVTKVADYDPRMAWLHAGKILDTFVKDLSADDKRALLQMLTTTMTKFGNRAAVDQLNAILGIHPFAPNADGDTAR